MYTRPAHCCVMMREVLDVPKWRNELENIYEDTKAKSKVLTKATKYVVAMAKISMMKLTEEEIRETAAMIMDEICEEEI